MSMKMKIIVASAMWWVGVCGYASEGETSVRPRRDVEEVRELHWQVVRTEDGSLFLQADFVDASLGERKSGIANGDTIMIEKLYEGK
jgi:hypothetical protein